MNDYGDFTSRPPSVMLMSNGSNTGALLPLMV